MNALFPYQAYLNQSQPPPRVHYSWAKEGDQLLIYYVILARLALVIHPKLKCNLKSSTKNETLGIKKSCGQCSAACSIEKILLETDCDFTKQPFSKKENQQIVRVHLFQDKNNKTTWKRLIPSSDLILMEVKFCSSFQNGTISTTKR